MKRRSVIGAVYGSFRHGLSHYTHQDEQNEGSFIKIVKEKSIVTKTKTEQPKNGADDGTMFQPLKKGVSSGHIDLFYTPLESSRFLH